jgi:hypothetical protein
LKLFSFLLAAITNSILCSATLAILHGILASRWGRLVSPARYRRSVKDVPEHSVKDVMKPYT